MLKLYGEVIKDPYEIQHTETEFKELVSYILDFNEEIKVVLEATGVYSLPVITYFKEHNIFVSVINPLIMKKIFCYWINKRDD